MLKFVQILICYSLLLALVFAVTESRPQNTEGNQDTDTVDTDGDDMRSVYGYDSPAAAIYPSIPMDRLQMLIAQYRPNAYLRSPSYAGMNELFRLPETKRQVRYRQCYFNPISCFKK